MNALVPALRSRARETEQLKHMHPDNLEDLTQAGVFKLTLPKSHGGYEAGPREMTEVLAQIARGCASTSWICSIISASNLWLALLPDESANEILATPDLRCTGLIAPTGKARSVDGGVRLSGTFMWNTGGIHSQYLWLVGMLGTDGSPSPIACLVPTEEVELFQTWDASGMSGTATNKVVAEDVFIPQERVVSVATLATGQFPQRQFSGNPYYNRSMVQVFLVMSAPTMLGMARGAMDVYLEKLPSRGITYSTYSKAGEAALTHHQVATAQLHLDTAELMMRALEDLLLSSWNKEASLADRIKTRAWLGHIARNAKACVNTLFEASGGSAIQHASDIQRYFRDANSLNLHALIQPTSSDELYGRHLCGLEPNTTLV
ncbi:acyl-CoA dehydrogenase family protein [Streptomyces sp. NPDC004629]|uniref:acyl-CoA dehydrogenase family protein n=1 Tax=Streptomyces sp. NPDC004629 TaxID=3364705 RepID=UPI0036910BB7